VRRSDAIARVVLVPVVVSCAGRHRTPRGARAGDLRHPRLQWDRLSDQLRPSPSAAAHAQLALATRHPRTPRRLRSCRELPMATNATPLHPRDGMLVDAPVHDRGLIVASDRSVLTTRARCPARRFGQKSVSRHLRTSDNLSDAHVHPHSSNSISAMHETQGYEIIDQRASCRSQPGCSGCRG